MPDISMCKGGECPLKEKCRRFLAKPSEYRQAYFMVPPFVEESCNEFVQATKHEIIDYWKRWIPQDDQEGVWERINTYLRIYGGELVPALGALLQGAARFPLVEELSEDQIQSISNPTSVSVMSLFSDDSLDCLNVLINNIPVRFMHLDYKYSAAFAFPDSPKAMARIKEVIEHDRGYQSYSARVGRQEGA